MQINLPSQSCIRDSQEADTPTHPPKGDLMDSGRDSETTTRWTRRSHVLMLLVNFVVLHLLLMFSTNGMQKESNEEVRERERVNVEDESLCVCE